ncbi:hypothetical protein C6I20_10515 [Aeromicrobium sp. A1-2]|uniref:hypothetical protein n=1 Tax=Aeromicrobium sp. A1-2 TaxID=2107713 RepID=UPI000E47030E|nr:hypothetical protein [Aeromicrobium sp. A1-2]AXT85583.1 hypothetical protein C6I20_10515 [Aeromicrobium sp. A1-2]
MHLPTDRVNRVALAAMVLGAAIIVGTLLTMWLGGSDESSAPAGTGSSSAFRPLPDALEVEPIDPDETDGLAGTGLGAKIGSDDPFATESGDNTLHKVVLTFTADGGMYAGWRYRGKSGSGVKVADRSLVLTKTVRGGLPVAQMGVQVLGTSTYATCTISVDGVKVSTQTARGVNHVVVCVG